MYDFEERKLLMYIVSLVFFLCFNSLLSFLSCEVHFFSYFEFGHKQGLSPALGVSVWSSTGWMPPNHLCFKDFFLLI